MNIHSPSGHVLVKGALLTPITAAANNSTGVDTQGATRALVTFSSNPTGTGTTSDCKLQDSADNSTFADVATAAFAQVTTAGAAGAIVTQVMDVDLSKRKRYLRVVHTGAGGSAAGNATASILLFNHHNLPPAQDNTVVSV